MFFKHMANEVQLKVEFLVIGYNKIMAFNEILSEV